ncbi:MAG: diguanylate cyclase [Gemmatimonadaceae bacterium]
MSSGPIIDILTDVRDLTGASCAALWNATASAVAPILVQHSAVDGSAPQLDAKGAGLVAWAAQQSVGEMCTDGDVVHFAATPVIATDELRLILSVSSIGASGINGDLRMQRDELRRWLPRFAARILTVRSLLDSQAAGNRAERHADLLLLTAAQVHEHRTVEELGFSLCSAASHMTGARRVSLVRWFSATRVGEVAYATRGHLVSAGWPVSSSSETGAACLDGKPVMTESAAGRDSLLRVYGGDEPERTLGALAIIPLRGTEGVIGALVMENDAAAPVSPTDAKHLRLLGLLGAAALETVWEIEEINRRARTDALTGLANRQQFEERLTRIVVETKRFGGSCALVVVDIDRFKHVNDTFGHQSGDQILQQVAATLQKEVRTVDLLARYGGEEMAFLLPQTELSGGCQLAERLRQAVSARPFVVQGREIPITISLGVAAYPAGARDRDDLFAVADRALYEAKRGGRNRVVSDTA